MSSPTPFVTLALTLGISVAAATGCRTGGKPLDPRYRQLSHEFVTAQHQPEYAVAVSNPVAPELAGAHSVDEYIRIGLQQNSEIQEARLMVESLANRVPQAASLPDPVLGATAYPSPVQTAAGEQVFALSMKQKVPWSGKLATRAAIAEEDVNAARARLAAVELKVVEQIRNAYYQLDFIQQAISIIEHDKEQLELIENVVERLYRVKRNISQQDVLQVQVALSKIDTELARFRQQKESARAKLARLLHISPETKLEAMESQPPQKMVQDIHLLYEQAIES